MTWVGDIVQIMDTNVYKIVVMDEQHPQGKVCVVYFLWRQGLPIPICWRLERNNVCKEYKI